MTIHHGADLLRIPYRGPAPASHAIRHGGLRASLARLCELVQWNAAQRCVCANRDCACWQHARWDDLLGEPAKTGEDLRVELACDHRSIEESARVVALKAEVYDLRAELLALKIAATQKREIHAWELRNE